MAINELQSQVRDFDRRFGWEDDEPEHTLIHMAEELGEISREMLKRTSYRSDEPDLSHLNDELTDLMYLSLKLGNLLGIDLEEGWSRIPERYARK